ncbi:twin-arginine translocation signal domain-containing protein [Pelagibius sp. Alg239-R121]|uniref:twin-arginine translocation signal domain-containing protein n=1 Tax=Pelagibius sp. Alg239-R121 TaxID=2993448 RepID=UPI0024A6EDF0|nr:twin-arginine translocation signal domain-containing protein [Pelagibius sp. Alg239-R121]
MKRQKHKTKPAGARKTSVQDGTKAPGKKTSRRDFLRTFGEWGVVGAAVGVGGWYAIGYVSATIGELDLTKLGNGTPTIVQIHDPQCPRCVELQGETRDALADFSDGELQYLVANIRSDSGRDFANAQGVGHVTLLLFDGTGRRRDVLVGNNTSETLKREFQRLLRMSNAGNESG